MNNRKLYEGNGHAYFITTTCYKHRRLLDHDRAKRIVIAALSAQLNGLKGECIGYVVMPNHVHTIVWFPEPDRISNLMKK